MTDDYRETYRELTGTERAAIRDVKRCANHMRGLIENAPTKDERRRAIAKTKLEEVVMWAVKAISG